jgi:WD40 repeat protein
MEAHAGFVTGVVCADGHVISAGYDGQLIWWHAEKREKVRGIKAHQRWIRSLELSPDRKTVASVADDMVCRLWDADTGALRHELRGHEAMTPHHFNSMLYACGFSSDGRLLATADKVGRVNVWETSSGKQVGRVEAPGMYTWDPVARIHSIGGVRSVAFSPNGELLAVGGMGKVGNIDHLEGKTRIEVFRWEKGERVAELQGDKTKGLVNDLAFLPGGEHIMGTGGDGKGCLVTIDPAQKKVLREEAVPAHVHRFVLDESGRKMHAAAHHRLLVLEA